MRRLTVDNLVAEVQSMIDETNTANVDIKKDILPALNRAQDKACNILARHFDDPLLTYKMVQPTAGTSEYPIPEDAFEQRLEKIEVKVNQVFYEVHRISYRDITLYQTPQPQNSPYYYAIIGNKYKLLPSPSATYPIRIWYLRDPKPLVMPQGRITSFNTGSNYLIVDSVGEDVDTNIDSLASYLNIVDGETGDIKATLQVQSVNGRKVTFKTVPSRSEVLGLTVGTGLPTDIAADDLICLAEGTCVPFLKKPMSNYVIQYAVAEITRKLGGTADMELRVTQDLEQVVERSWAGREQDIRVKKRSKQWGFISRRLTY